MFLGVGLDSTRLAARVVLLFLASNELQEERRKHKATAKALQKLRTAPPPAEQVSLHHEESKHRDELRTALALDRAATHFGTSPPSSSSSSSSSSSFVDQ
jgi:hypothetical protein